MIGIRWLNTREAALDARQVHLDEFRTAAAAPHFGLYAAMADPDFRFESPSQMEPSTLPKGRTGET